MQAKPGVGYCFKSYVKAGTSARRPGRSCNRLSTDTLPSLARALMQLGSQSQTFGKVMTLYNEAF